MKNIKINEILQNKLLTYVPYNILNDHEEIVFDRVKGKYKGLNVTMFSYWDKASKTRNSILIEDQVLIELAETIKKHLDSNTLTSDQKVDMIYQHLQNLKTSN